MIATRRSTAGKGFEFEDYVAAWLVLEALAGRTLSVSGVPQRLQMQTGPLLWDIDDILFSAQDTAGEVHLAISCKGNVQVSANGLPESFATQAWKLRTKADSPLNRAGDVMALATQGTHRDFQAAWSEIKTAASGGDPALATAQIRATPRYRRLFDALKAAAVAPVDDAAVLALIRQVEVLPFDFKLAQSKDERSAVAVARSLLTDGTQEDAKRLWSELVSRAKETRLGSGTLELSDLLQSGGRLALRAKCRKPSLKTRGRRAEEACTCCCTARRPNWRMIVSIRPRHLSVCPSQRGWLQAILTS